MYNKGGKIKTNNLWEKDFESKSIITTPKSIVEEQCALLSQKTRGLVIAKISEYTKPIASYRTIGMKDVVASISIVGDGKEVDIQDELGELNEFNFKYEFFITSTQTPNYKYRALFLQHNISIYPVTLVLDESISKELGWQNYIGQCDTEETFIQTLAEILNFEKIYSVINSLYSLAIKEIKF